MKEYSDISNSSPPQRLFGRQRPLHGALGGGKVADVLLWRDSRVSGVILVGMTSLWFLFQVVGYSLVTLLCHLSITTMLVIFIWSSAADFLNWNPPNIRQTIVEDSTSRYVAAILHRSVNQLLSNFMYVATGCDPKLFFLTILSLWIISVIGSSMDSLNLLFLGAICLGSLPVVYEKYEDEVDYVAYEAKNWLKNVLNKFDTEIMEKIPRRAVKHRSR